MTHSVYSYIIALIGVMFFISCSLTVTPECVTIFTVSVAGYFRYQMPGDAAWAAAMLEKIRMFNKIH